MLGHDIVMASRGGPKGFSDLVRKGQARVVPPATDIGYKAYGGTGRLMLMASTNVVPDPQGVLANGAFWPGSTGNTEITANVDPPLPLPAELRAAGLAKCLRLQNSGTADTPVTANVAVTASKDYYTSLYIYAPTLGGNLTIVANIKDNAHTFNVAALTGANTGWYRYSVKSPTVATETTLKIQFAFAGGTASDVYVTGAGAVQESSPMPFFCGLTSGCAWSGSVNASSSTRVASLLRYARSQFGAMTSGFVAMRFTPLFIHGEGSYARLFTTQNSDNSTQMTVSLQVFADNWRMYTRGADGTSPMCPSAADPFTLARGTPHYFVGRWTQGVTGTLDLNVDGADKAQAVQNATVHPGNLIAIGDAQSNNAQANGYVGPCIVGPAPLTNAHTAALSSMMQAGESPVNMFRFLRDNGYAVTVLPMDGDSLAYQVAS